MFAHHNRHRAYGLATAAPPSGPGDTPGHTNPPPNGGDAHLAVPRRHLRARARHVPDDRADVAAVGGRAAAAGSGGGQQPVGAPAAAGSEPVAFCHRSDQADAQHVRQAGCVARAARSAAVGQGGAEERDSAAASGTKQPACASAFAAVVTAPSCRAVASQSVQGRRHPHSSRQPPPPRRGGREPDQQLAEAAHTTVMTVRLEASCTARAEFVLCM
eukprot:7384374-Prymnesium_polylepis.1